MGGRTLLHRSKLLGARVSFMMHKSENPDLEQSQTHCHDQAEMLFDSWRAKGCNEWFAASFGAPGKFWKTNPCPR